MVPEETWKLYNCSCNGLPRRVAAPSQCWSSRQPIKPTCYMWPTSACCHVMLNHQHYGFAELRALRVHLERVAPISEGSLKGRAKVSRTYSTTTVLSAHIQDVYVIKYSNQCRYGLQVESSGARSAISSHSRTDPSGVQHICSCWHCAHTISYSVHVVSLATIHAAA
jgi:hypothetical protein